VASGRTRGRTGPPGNGRGAPAEEVSPQDRLPLERSAPTRWPAITAACGPPPTGTWTRSSRTGPRGPDLRAALERARAEGFPHVILDGTVIPGDRCRQKTFSVRGEAIDLWYLGKAHVHGGNIQAVMAPDGFPLWVSGPSPARCTTSPPPACTPCPLYPAVAAGLPTLADPGYDGAGIGIHISVRHPADGRDSISIPAPATSCSVPALPRGTRVRPAHRSLAHPAVHHRQSLQDRRYRPGCARPDSFRVRLHQMKIAEITSCRRCRIADNVVVLGSASRNPRWGEDS
jgi:hypothetical protein